MDTALLPDFLTLLTAVAQQIESQANRELPTDQEWLGDAQALSCKLFNHLQSIHILAHGTKLHFTDNPHISFIDHSSLAILARAALETYLVFFYIYAPPKDEQSIVRYKAWTLAGLIDRQKYHVSTKESKAKLSFEKDQIKKITQEIMSAPCYAQLGDKQRKSILKGQWRAGLSWNELGQIAGFHPTYFRDIYSHLCGYAHSSYLCALQIDQARSIDDQITLTRFVIKFGMILMSHFITAYPSVFPGAKAIIQSNEEARGLAHRWYFNHENMSPIYQTNASNDEI